MIAIPFILLLLLRLILQPRRFRYRYRFRQGLYLRPSVAGLVPGPAENRHRVIKYDGFV